MIQWLKRLFGLDGSLYQPPAPTPGPTVVSEIDQGDYDSGPFGYSPNTAYPETQYGSGFVEQADWNDNEHWEAGSASRSFAQLETIHTQPVRDNWLRGPRDRKMLRRSRVPQFVNKVLTRLASLRISQAKSMSQGHKKSRTYTK